MNTKTYITTTATTPASVPVAVSTKLSSIATSSTACATLNYSNTLRTLPRKRRPRAVGEVSITCPSSYVYLNAEPQEEDENGSFAKKEPPIYVNTCIEELKDKLETIQKSAGVEPHNRNSTGNVRPRHQRIHLTFIRATIAEVDETREGMVMSTYIGWYLNSYFFYSKGFYNMYVTNSSSSKRWNFYAYWVGAKIYFFVKLKKHFF